jgi:hypothetical protein
MTRNALSIDIRRMLWRFNVSIASYVHPDWVGSRDIRPVCGSASISYLQSQCLIEQHRLGLVGMDVVESENGRFVLLEVDDLKKLTCLGAALGVAGQLKLLVFGKSARDCVRVLGREVSDLALQLESHPIAGEFKILGIDAGNTPLPKRLLQIQRSLLKSLCDGVPNAAAQRMRLRFRPGYFDRVQPVNGAGAMAPALLKVAQYANLSEQAKCILRY